MPLHPIRLGTAALIGFFALAGDYALAQGAPPPAPGAVQAPPQGPVKVDLQPLRPDWLKVCGKVSETKEVCFTTRDYSDSPDHPPIAVAVYEIKGEDSVIRFLLPPGFLLLPGIRLSVDKGAVQDGKFTICMPNGCFAEGRVKTALVDSMKKGTLLNVLVRSSINSEVTFTLPLSGFGKAFDGPPVDPKVLEQERQAQQADLQKQLEERAKQQRQSLEQNGAAPAAPAPAAKP